MYVATIGVEVHVYSICGVAKTTPPASTTDLWMFLKREPLRFEASRGPPEPIWD